MTNFALWDFSIFGPSSQTKVSEGGDNNEAFRGETIIIKTNSLCAFSLDLGERIIKQNNRGRNNKKNVHSTTMYYSILHSIILYYSILLYTTQYYDVLHDATLYITLLFCTIH